MSHTVYLAEKPSVSADIARMLGIEERGKGYYKVPGGYVTHAIGHMYELVEPKAYNPAWQRWAFEHLPMIPEKFKRAPAYKRGEQISVIKKMIKGAATVVIATDAGREGELIAREVIEECGFKGQLKRLWLQSMNDPDLLAALNALRDGREFDNLYDAAYARQVADWLFGMNGTRAVSLAANVGGDFFPVGRVKTPTLALTVRREREIENFVVRDYYELIAEVTTQGGQKFKMVHAPKDEDRIFDKKVAEGRMAQALGVASPLSVVSEEKTQKPPLPFNLPDLQREANKTLGLTAKEALAVAQELYEAKKLTYPRSDARHLPKSMIEKVPEIVAGLAVGGVALAKIVQAEGWTTRESTFDDSKMTDHHGIIPTGVVGNLTGRSKDVFELVAKRFLLQLLPDCQYLETRVSLDANGVPFKAGGRVIRQAGWTAHRGGSK